MAVFNSAVLTARGNELLVDAVAGDKIIFTRMVVGCGEYSDEEKERRALEKVTALKDVRQEFTFSAHKKVSEQCVLLTAVISNRELEHSYKITEIGIYGKRSEDEEDFLCSIAVTKSLDESDTFPPYNGLQECQIVQDYYVTISPDAEVSVNTQGACVLREELENFKNVIFNILDGKIDKAAVANNLLTTVEGYVLDARQGEILKGMIDAVKQAFQDGCRLIVGRLTALGYEPVTPQGPTQIVDAINTMYIDRYNQGYGDGRAQGRADVIADPAAYGIVTAPHVTLIGSISLNTDSQLTQTFDVKHIPNYQNLTVRNFFLNPTTGRINYKSVFGDEDREVLEDINRYMEANDGYSGEGPAFNYDAENGILYRGPISYIHSTATGHFGRIKIGGDIYCIY